MTKNQAKIIITLVIALMSLTQWISVHTQRVKAQSQTNQGVSTKPTDPGWKNIQVLKGLKTAPQNDLYNAMDFMAGSLGVSCDFCHAGAGYDSDLKKTKLKAREMIKMTRAINEANFGGRLEVTCNTCHQGTTSPNAKPSPWNKTPEEFAAYKKLVESVTEPAKSPGSSEYAPAASNPETAWPTAEQVLASYHKAVGGDAVKSLRMTGTGTSPLRATAQFELYAVLPDQMLLGLTMPGLQAKQILNRDHGWLVTSAVTRAPMTAEQMENTRRTLQVFLPIKYASSDSPPKVVGVEKLGERTCYVVESHSVGTSLRLYFDAQSGLIYKARREIESLLGTSASETLFDDYREVSGVKLPYSITNLFMANKAQYQIAEIQTNLDVDRAMFEPPAPKERKEIKIEAKLFDNYVGNYQGPNRILKITRDGDRYFLDLSNGAPQFEMFAETETDFFLKVADIRITFVKNAKGEVTDLVLHQGNVDQKFAKGMRKE